MSAGCDARLHRPLEEKFSSANVISFPFFTGESWLMTNEHQKQQNWNLGLLWETPLSSSWTVHCCDMRIDGGLNITIYFVQRTLDNFVRFYRLSGAEWSGVKCTWEGRLDFPTSYFLDTDRPHSFTKKIEESDWLVPPHPLTPDGTSHYFIATHNNVVEIATHIEPKFEVVSESEAESRNLLEHISFYNVCCNTCGRNIENYGMKWGQRCSHAD